MSIIQRALLEADPNDTKMSWREETKDLPPKLAMISALMRGHIGNDDMREAIKEVIGTLDKEVPAESDETIAEYFQNYINRRL